MENDTLNYLIQLVDDTLPEAIISRVIWVLLNISLSSGDVCARMVFDAQVVSRVFGVMHLKSIRELGLHLLRNLIADEDGEIFECVAPSVMRCILERVSEDRKEASSCLL